MAFAVLFSLSQTITDRILSHDDEYPISVDGKQRIASLHEIVISLREFLEKSPKKAKRLETRISCAANEAEDIIEHFMYEHIRYKSIRSSGATSSLYDLRELKTVMDEINSIAREARENLPAVDSPMAPSFSSTQLTSLSGCEPVGLDEDLKKMRNMLRQGSTKCRIIPITGMGGIGKTILARYAYHDKLIEESFEVRAWATVSQDYNSQNIFSNLLDCLTNVITERSGQRKESIKDQVYLALKGRKYLIVLDDVWSTDVLYEIRNVFPDDGNGSRILITTRLEGVASHADPSGRSHKMRFMDDNQSWTLLEQKVFPNKVCPAALVKMGKDIAKRCGGLPLAIVLVAGMLSSGVSATPPSWEEFAKNVRSFLDKDEQLDRIMSLSYLHLPHHLRPCFLYMGGFPEDYEIRVSNLTKLWIAEGFIVPEDSKSLEEVAEECLEDLVGRSLALVTGRKSNGKIKSCNVHDFLRDLSRRKAEDEGFERRLSNAHRDLKCLAKAYGSTLRSVVCFQPSDTSLKSLPKLKLLRVLDAVDTDAYLLPDQVFDLFHLRYLAFGCPMVIPAAISRLQNLRILIVRPSKTLRRFSNDDEVYLPLQIWSLPLLTVLVSFFDLLPNPESEAAAAAASALVTLSVVKKLICTKEMMEKIPNIKKLGVTYFGDKYQQDYQLQNLALLHRLENLKLVMTADSIVHLNVNPVFPPTLKKLTLSGWRLPWKYLENAGPIPNLQVLKLRDHAFEGHTWVTSEQQFGKLEFLEIDGSDLQKWDSEDRHFPRLKFLLLYRCSLLREIPTDFGEIPTLQLIEVDYANESLVECVKQIEEEQKENENNSLQVRCVHM